MIIPLEIAIYECDPDWTLKQKFWNSFCFFFGEVLVVAILFIATFFIFNKVHIPVASKQCPIDLTMKIYAIALLSFISYLLFMLFGGVGLFSFPLDLIYSFCTRPIKIKPGKLEEMKKEIVVTAADLKDLAMQLKKLEELGHHKKNMFSKDRRHYNDLLKQLKVGVSVVEDQYEIIDFQDKANKTSALGYLMIIYNNKKRWQTFIRIS